MLGTVCVAFSAVFFLVHAVMWGALAAEAARGRVVLRRQALGAPGRAEPRLSVVVPARNEAERVRPLLASLAAQDHPALEIVFVDDRSSDATPAILADFAASHPGLPVRIVRLEANPGPNFKQRALAAGIDAATGDLILFTDADCSMPATWASSMAARLSDPRVGLVIGPVFKAAGAFGFLRTYQAFDHAVRYMYLVGGAGLGSACGGFGNNLAFRRAVLDAIGGYGAVPYSVTEDAAFISAVRSKTGFRIRAAVDPGSRVTTDSVGSWRELVHQGLRWNAGGLFAPDAATRAVFWSLMLGILAGVVSVPLAFFFPAFAWPAAAVYASMAGNTIATLAIAGRGLPGPRLRYVLQWAFTPAYFSALTVLGLAGAEVRWKDATLETPAP